MKPSVLFVNVVWTERYDGTEIPMGNFRYLKTKRFAKYGASDERLFVQNDGLHYCGLGRGAINVEKLDAVFVAKDPRDNKHRVVAIFRDLSWKTDGKDGWTNGFARSDEVTCFPVDERIEVSWPPGQQNRRWARGGPSNNWPDLLDFYERLNSKLPGSRTRTRSADESQLLELFRSFEIEEQQRMLQQIHRVIRDQKLRPVVLALWGPSCAACGMSLGTQEDLYECEIAHIHQVRDQGADSPGNALPLCRTHHWAFDQHLWGIEAKSKKIFVRSAYRNHPALLGLHQSNLKSVRHGAERNLDETALRIRWKLSLLN
ncbi:hypothetical protein F0U60_05210 [Archangium minus]|uniref:HNH nuclease domain-containing protein n=1 Tax=Archangium minus TaxID=83450 RepID=A0ABY9WIH2_9BACT|nr:hypothetical protein F0U60_05210 [Archangium minus]